jgi:hypothetical protein
VALKKMLPLSAVVQLATRRFSFDLAYDRRLAFNGLRLRPVVYMHVQK